MKSVSATILLLAAVLGVNADVDWSSVKSMDIEVKVPLTPRLAELTGSSGRITRGQIAERNQFPYQAGLKLYLAEGSAWCGGTVISDRWILTAAHCTDNLTTGVDVYLGAFNRNDKSEVGQQIIFVQTSDVIVHENWEPTTLLNDISLIKLPAPIEFNKYIQPAKLPSKSTSYSNYEGEQAVASGWGKTSDAEKGATDKLQFAELPILKNSACNKWFLGSIKDTHICIKTTGGISTCNGDSGGPLVSKDTNELIGATSFGIIFGCEIGFPGVFTRITSYLPWILEKTGLPEN